MAVDVSWDDAEQTILKVVLRDWGWDDIARDEAIEARRAMFDAAPRPVTMLIVMHDAPRNLLGMLPHLAQSPGFTHPNVRLIVVVADKGILKIATDIFQRVYGQPSRRLRVVRTLDEAYRAIAESQPDETA